MRFLSWKGNDACEGDSGGPLYIWVGHKTPKKGKKPREEKRRKKRRGHKKRRRRRRKKNRRGRSKRRKGKWRRKKAFIIGVISRGHGCALRDKAGVYTR